MAIAISDSYLHKIEMMSNEMMSNEDKLDLVDFIIKSMRAASSKIRVGVNAHSKTWIDELEGKWIDSKCAEDMIADIKSSRTKNSDVIL